MCKFYWIKEPQMTMDKKIAVGADHAGFELKTHLVEHLKENGYDVLDVGTDSEESVDYPDYAVKVAQAVACGRAGCGLLICGSGLGAAIAANKVADVRAVTANTVELARLSRQHNDANVLAVGARIVEPGVAEEILDSWLDMEYEGGRHQRRVDKITRLENRKRE